MAFDGPTIILDESLDLLPTAGTAWNGLVAKSTTDPGTGTLAPTDQLHPLAVYSIALRWRKDGGGLGRTYALNEILAVMGTEKSASQPLNPYRTLGAYVLALELLDTDPNDPVGRKIGANGMTVDAWMQQWPHAVMPGGNQNWGTLVKCSRISPNNWGACARASLLAVALWLRKRGLNPTNVPSGDSTTAQGLIDDVIRWFKRWCGDTSVPNSFTPTNAFDPSWDGPNTTFPTTQGVINPDSTDVARRGMNCEDASRSDFGPPLRNAAGHGSGEHYQYEALESALFTIALLINAGYPDAAAYGNSGVRRNFKAMMDNGLTVPDSDFHRYFWMLPTMANWIWSLGFPIPSGYPSDRSQRRLITTHVDWFASPGSTWLKVAGSGTDGGTGGGGGGTVTRPPTVDIKSTAVSGLQVTVDVTGGILAGSAALAYTDVIWSVGATPERFTGNLVSHTFGNVAQRTDFEVTVRAFDVNGLSGSDKAIVTIVPVDGRPSARITLTPSAGTIPFTSQYDMTLSSDPQGQTLVRRIDFGDGTVLDNAPAVGEHTWTKPVTRIEDATVSATVTDPDGNVSTAAIALVTLRPATLAAAGGLLWVVVNEVKYPVQSYYSKAWDGPHFVQDNWHEWVDAAGRKRGKLGAPTGDLDGVILSGSGVLALPAGSAVPPGTAPGTIFYGYTA